MNSAWPICRLVRPWATSASTSTSRRVSPREATIEGGAVGGAVVSLGSPRWRRPRWASNSTSRRSGCAKCDRCLVGCSEHGLGLLAGLPTGQECLGLPKPCVGGLERPSSRSQAVAAVCHRVGSEAPSSRPHFRLGEQQAAEHARMVRLRHSCDEPVELGGDFCGLPPELNEFIVGPAGGRPLSLVGRQPRHERVPGTEMRGQADQAATDASPAPVPRPVQRPPPRHCLPIGLAQPTRTRAGSRSPGGLSRACPSCLCASAKAPWRARSVRERSAGPGRPSCRRLERRW